MSSLALCHFLAGSLHGAHTDCPQFSPALDCIVVLSSGALAVGQLFRSHGLGVTVASCNLQSLINCRMRLPTSSAGSPWGARESRSDAAAPLAGVACAPL